MLLFYFFSCFPSFLSPIQFQYVIQKTIRFYDIKRLAETNSFLPLYFTIVVYKNAICYCESNCTKIVFVYTIFTRLFVRFHQLPPPPLPIPPPEKPPPGVNPPPPSVPTLPEDGITMLFCIAVV